MKQEWEVAARLRMARNPCHATCSLPRFARCLSHAHARVHARSCTRAHTHTRARARARAFTHILLTTHSPRHQHHLHSRTLSQHVFTPNTSAQTLNEEYDDDETPRRPVLIYEGSQYIERSIVDDNTPPDLPHAPHDLMMAQGENGQYVAHCICVVAFL
jgi:hypothetical protein